MKFNTIKIGAIAMLVSLTVYNCSKDNNSLEMGYQESMNAFAKSAAGIYVQEDQMGRPAVNTVFVSSGSKDLFNATIPSEQAVMFQSMFQSNLEGLSPAYSNPEDINALGFDSATFSGFLATDVLNASLEGPTTFYDGEHLLTGRALSDDVITVELLLIFGGEDFTENPTLSDDHVDANDKEFSKSFPYLASPW